jgi:RNA polymerase sigma-70 factor (ECF subfamily)
MDESLKVDAARRTSDLNVAFTLTVLPHEPSLLRRARRLVGNEADAFDLVQETMERALRTFHVFRPGTAVWAWLKTILKSVWIDAWRRRRAAAKLAFVPALDMAPLEEPVGPEREGTDAEAMLARLPEALTQLPPMFREVLELRLQANWSYGAIAQRLGIPSRTVGTRILRARRQLRAILERELSATPERQGPSPRPGSPGVARSSRSPRARRTADQRPRCADAEIGFDPPIARGSRNQGAVASSLDSGLVP